MRVNVVARIESGGAPCSRIRNNRAVKRYVFPVPAEARRLYLAAIRSEHDKVQQAGFACLRWLVPTGEERAAVEALKESPDEGTKNRAESLLGSWKAGEKRPR